LPEWSVENSTNKTMLLLSKLFIFTGIVCYVLGIYNIWLINVPNRLSFGKYSYAQESPNTKISQPKRIVVSNLNIDLPLIPSKIIDGNWETTDQGASYLESSPIPGETGNSIIYAHNWASLFGNLISILPGDEVKIEYSNGSIKNFRS
jgi:Sortase (surface protein transpeptidase)